MKKIVSLLFAVLFSAAFIFQTVVWAEDDEGEQLRSNNTDFVNTYFSITSTGMAEVDVSYTGYNGITTGAIITIIIKKNTFLFFWSTKVDETYIINGYKFSHTYYFDLSEFGSGTYKCYVDYSIMGSGGPADEFNFEDTDSW